MKKSLRNNRNEHNQPQHLLNNALYNELRTKV